MVRQPRGPIECLDSSSSHCVPSTAQEQSPPSSSVDVEDGNFELESVLLEEEEYGIPLWNRHRTETGLGPLDDRLSTESHDFIEHDGKEKGLACASILEVVGTPGCGKTTLLVQIAVLERLNGIFRTCRDIEAEGEGTWTLAGDAAQQVMLIGECGNLSRLMDVHP